MPANVAAISMLDRCSSEPSCTDARNDVAMRPIAFSHHRSETGFEPQ
jgi:hypothetical protein